MSDPVQIFVRNDQGTVWGPLAPATVELLIDSGLIPGKLQVALDGVHFTFPGRVPNVRQYFPRAMWGDAIAPGDDLNAPPPPPPPVPTEMTGEAAPAAGPATSPDGPVAGPGVAPTAGPGIGIRAGPGATGPRAGPGATARPPGRATVPGQRPQAPARPPPRLGAPAAPAAVDAEPLLDAEVMPAVDAEVMPELEAEVEPLLDAEVMPALEAEVLAADDDDLPPEEGTDPGFEIPPQLARPAAPPTLKPAPPPIEAPADMPQSGSLDDLGPLRLYYVAASADATGLLTIKSSGHTLELHFRKGGPEYFGSDHPDDDVGAYLMRQGLLNSTQLKEATANTAKFGGELVAALFGMGIINPQSAFTYLAQRAQAILLKAMLVQTGTFRFEAIELPAHRAMPLGNKWGILTEQIRRMPIAEVKRRLGEAMDMPVMKAGGRVEPSELKLTPQEMRALSHFDGVRSLNQLEADLPQDADNHARVAWYLQQLEAVSFAAVKLPSPKAVAPPPRLDVGEAARTQPGTGGPPKPGTAQKPAPAGAPKPAAAAPPRPAPVAAKPVAPPKPSAPKPAAPPRPAAGPVDLVAQLKELEKFAEVVRKQSYFELLGVKKGVDAAGVRVAYLKLARTYHPDTVPPDAPPGFAKLKEEIFGKIGDAQRVLSDPAQQENYVLELEAGSSDKLDVARILQAEDQFHRGEILVKARKFPDAVRTLDEAIKNNPDEGEYYAWRGYAKFFMAADKKTSHPEALRDINLCIAKNPRCSPAYYFLGHIAKVMGDTREAKKQFTKCLELNPKYTDAERELRLMK